MSDDSRLAAIAVARPSFALNSAINPFAPEDPLRAPRKVTGEPMAEADRVMRRDWRVGRKYPFVHPPSIGRLSKRRELVRVPHPGENPKAARQRGNPLDCQKSKLGLTVIFNRDRFVARTFRSDFNSC
jgi:hypothetical protein